MWRSCFLTTSTQLVVCSLLAVCACAAPPAPTLLSQAGGLPCQIVMGRIVMAEQRSLGTRSDTFEDANSGHRETLCVQTSAGQTVVRFERSDAKETFAVDFLSQGDLRLRHEQGANTVLFTQPVRGPLTLEIKNGEQTQKLSASTLWHLVLTEPTLCRTQLLPLLDQLRPDWQFAEDVAAIEAALQAASQTHEPLDRAELSQLIEQLSSPKFATRQQADRALQARGLSLLPELEQLHRQTLDAEQLRRLDDIQKRLTAASADTPERVAAWLIADRRLWKQLAELHASPLHDLARQHLTTTRD